MIDLDRTESQMLAAIGGNPPAPDRARSEWRIAGTTPAELLHVIAARLSQDYADLPDAYVAENLLVLIKKGLGNGYKWGNQRDPNKQLIVTAVTSVQGAVITISDQGGGFDVSRVIRDGTFTHGGSGFAHFHKTPSVISYANGGRTLLIQFLSHGSNSSEAGTPAAPAAPAKPTRIGFQQLKQSDHVKVKCVRQRNGDLVATKITMKPPEECAVIEAPLQLVSAGAIRILGQTFTVSEQTEIVGADMQRTACGQLQAGQVVEVTGHFISARFRPVRIKIRRAATLNECELQATIEELHCAENRFHILGFLVVVDDSTVIRARETEHRGAEHRGAEHRAHKGS